jgi:hypothetical protein
MAPIDAVNMEAGWISVQIDAENGSGTWFLWINSLDGDLNAYQRVPAASSFSRIADLLGILKDGG